MTKNEIKAIISETAARYGFSTAENSWSRWPDIREAGTHYLNFMITENYAEDTDWTKREVTVEIHFRASLASMGGDPTPQDLLGAAETIRQGALLVQELEAMNLSHIETY